MAGSLADAPGTARSAEPAGPGSSARELTAAAGRRIGITAMIAIPLVVIAIFFGYPLLAMVDLGLRPDGVWEFSAFGDVLTRPRIRRLISFTLWQAAVSAALAVALGLPAAFLLYRRRFRGRSVMLAAFTVPFVLPTVVVGLAFKTLFADSGILGSWGLDGTVGPILAAHVFLNVAVVIRTVGARWAVLDERTAQAARSLGASGPRVLLTITVPALAPAIAGAFVMVFLFCATSFGVMVMLGGGALSTVETEIYRQTVDLLNLPVAAVLSILQLLLVVVVLLVAAWIRRRHDVTWRSVTRPPNPLSTADAPVLGYTLVLLTMIAVPMLTMLVYSLRTPTGWGLANYTSLNTLADNNILLVPVLTAFGNSLRAALIAAALAMALGVSLAVVLARRPRARWQRQALGALDSVLMLPLGVSAVTIGFGLLIALDSPPLDLRGSPVLVPLAQSLVTLPLVVRMVLPVLRSMDGRLREAAASLGAPPLTVWRTVDAPIARRALGGAAVFAFAVAMGEFGATSFLARPQEVTLPLVIARLAGRPGAENLGAALAASVLLALTCGIAVLLMEALAGSRAHAAAL